MGQEPSSTSGGHRAEAARRKAQEFAAEAKKWERLAENYEKGDEGELLTAQLLDILDGAGWVVLNDRYKSARSPANIDHIAIGPPGVCLIDTKNWSGRIAVDDRGLTQNGRRRDDELQEARAAAALVRAVARDTVARVVTAPVLCFIGDVGIKKPVYAHGVVALQHDQLLAWMTSCHRNLSVAEVTRLGSSLSAHFWPRSGPRPRPISVGYFQQAAVPRTPGRGKPPRATRPVVRQRPARPAGASAPGRGLALRLGLAALLILVLPKLVVAVITSGILHAPSPSVSPKVVAP